MGLDYFVKAAGFIGQTIGAVGSYFYVYYNATTTLYTAVDRANGRLTTNATAATLINALAARSTGGQSVTIEMDPNLSVAGTVTIETPNVTIYSNAFNAPTDTLPLIANLVINDVNAQVYRCKFQGLVFNTLTFTAGSNGITYTKFEDCAFIGLANRTTAVITYNYETNGTSNGIQYTKYITCWMNEQNTNLTLSATVCPPPFTVHFGGTGATAQNGHNEYVSCSYVTRNQTGTAPLVFIEAQGALQCGPPLAHFTDLDYVSQYTGNLIFFQDLCLKLAVHGTSFQGSIIVNGMYMESNAAHKIAALMNIGAGDQGLAAGGTSTPYEGRVHISDLQTVGGGNIQGVDCGLPLGYGTSTLTFTGGWFNGYVFTPVGSITPKVAATRDNGLTIASGWGAVATPLGTNAGALILCGADATNTYAQATGATAAKLGHSGIGTNNWYCYFNFGGGPLGWQVTTPTAPNAAVALLNMYPYPVQVIITAPGTATAATVTDWHGTATSLGTPVVGSTITLYPGEQLSYATAWPTTIEWRGVH